MNTQEALAGRIAAIENAVLCLAAAHANQAGSPSRAAILFYHEMFALATQRYAAAQPGPEKETQSRALDATHLLFERLQDLIDLAGREY